MEIILSEKQAQLIQAAANEQATLQQQAQTEFNKIQKRIEDIVAVVLDSKGLVSVPGIQFKDGKLILPDDSAPKEAEPVKKKK